MRQYLRRHLNWIQNSVFEGEVTDSELEEVKLYIKSIIDKNNDHIKIYQLIKQSMMVEINIGMPKAEPSNIL